ncbi:unnamed protein product [Schistosoma margrebowiei]|uniref:Rubicon Homology domain-containing protein n=1 Tax=Schistosoma margrebowiei TaxID=48269 RepID=A0AA84ZIC1_9TREM|nr:unnamed protein product [Schistosoma margrebowiei]
MNYGSVRPGITVKFGKRIIDPRYNNILHNVPIGIEATEYLQFNVDDLVTYDMSTTSPVAIYTMNSGGFLSPKSCHNKIHRFHTSDIYPKACWFYDRYGNSSNTVQRQSPCCHMVRLNGLIKSVSMEHLRCLKQTSVGYSQQTNGLKNSFVSCDRLNTTPFTDTSIPVESRSSGDGQTDDEEELGGVNYRITPDIRSKINSNSSNEVKVFLDPHSKSHSPSNSFTHDQINTKHLLLPGRSAFEKHLVREVAYFEICEFLIGQIEEIYDMENCEFLNSVYGEKKKDKSLQIPNDSQVHKSNTLPSSLLSSHMTLVDVTDQNLRNPLINSTLHSQSRETDYCEHCVDSATGLAVSLVNTCIQETAQNEKQEMILFKFLKLQEQLLKTCDINWVRLNQQFIESPRSTRFNYDTKFQNFSKNNRLSSPSSNSIQLNSQGRSNTFHHLTSLSQSSNSKRAMKSISQSDYSSSVLTSSSSFVNHSTTLSKPTINKLSNNSTIIIDTLSKNDNSNNNDNHANNRSLISLNKDFQLSGKIRSDNQDYPTSSLSLSSAFGCTPLPYGLLINPPIQKSKRKGVLASQNNRCAGCGAFIETRYLKRMRFCEFFGRYFCCVCHSNTLMTLPGNLVTCWDFRMLSVSNFARDRLRQLHNQPLLRTIDFNKQVLNRQSNLVNCLTLRKQGNLMLPFIQQCQTAQQLVDFTSIPSHWFETPDLWSMADLHSVHDGKLSITLRALLLPLVEHISICKRCLACGFICEICKSGQILFPFGQVNTAICSGCSACFHRACLHSPNPETCPRCIRRAVKREQLI